MDNPEDPCGYCGDARHWHSQCDGGCDYLWRNDNDDDVCCTCDAFVEPAKLDALR